MELILCPIFRNQNLITKIFFVEFGSPLVPFSHVLSTLHESYWMHYFFSFNPMVSQASSPQPLDSFNPTADAKHTKPVCLFFLV